MEKLISPKLNKNMPKILTIIFRILSIIILATAILSLIIFCLQLWFYYKTNLWRPLLTLSFAGLGFIGGFGLWKHQKWIVVIFGINFINVLVAQSLKLTHHGTCCSTTPPFAALAILLSGSILLLVYFSRRYLSGIYLRWLPIILFVGFVLLNQISLRHLLGAW